MMKKILILLSILGLSYSLCLAGQAIRQARSVSTTNFDFKSFQVNDVKGSIEEVPIAALGPEIRNTIIISQAEHKYIVLLRSVQPSFTLYASPPPE